MANNLEALRDEFSQPNPDREKIDRLHYGFLRAYQEILEFERLQAIGVRAARVIPWVGMLPGVFSLYDNLAPHTTITIDWGVR